MITCQFTVVVQFQTVQMCNFCRDSKQDAQAKSAFAIQIDHVILVPLDSKSIFGTKMGPCVVKFVPVRPFLKVVLIIRLRRHQHLELISYPWSKV